MSLSRARWGRELVVTLACAVAFLLLPGDAGADRLATSRAIDSLLVLADSASASRDTATVRRELERSRALATLLGNNSPKLADVLERFCAFHRSLGDFRLASSEGERAATIRERTLSAGSARLAASLQLWGNALADAGQLEQARQVLERALRIRQRAKPADEVATAQALYDLGTAVRRLGDYDVADSLADSCLAIRQRTLGFDDRDTGMAQLLKGMIAGQRGDIPGSLAAFDRALPVLERGWGADDYRVARGYMNYANVLDDAGEVDQARAYYDRSVPVMEAYLGPNHPTTALVLLNYATFLDNVFDHRGAKPLLQRAAAIQERILGPDNVELAYTLHSLSVVEDNLHEWPAARRAAERSLAIERKVLGPEHQRTALTEASLASILTNMGEFAAARPYLEHVVVVGDKVLDAGSRGVSLGMYGWNLLSTGEFVAAERALQRSLRTLEDGLGPEHSKLGVPLCTLALLRLIVNDDRGAFEYALRAETISRADFRIAARRMTERGAMESLRSRMSGLGIVLTVAARDSSADIRRAAWDAVIRSRSMLLDELAVRHHTIEVAGDTATRRLVDEWNEARDEVASLVEDGRGDDSLVVYRAKCATAMQSYERIEDRIAARSASFRSEVVDSRVGLEEVRRALEPSEALVAFVRYPDFGLLRGADSTRIVSMRGPETAVSNAYVAFVIRGGEAEPTLVRIGPATAVESQVSRWVRATTRPPLRASDPDEDRSYVELGAAMAKAIWRRIEPHLAGVTRVLVVPDGALNLVSFEALPAATGGYLIERGPVLQLVSTERDLVRYRGPSTPGQGLLAVGAPDFDLAPGTLAMAGAVRGARTVDCAGFQSMHFDSLAESGREVAEISELWGRIAGTGSPPTTTSLLGAQADEMTLRREARGRRVIHVATHGFFLSSCAGGGHTPTASTDLVEDVNPLLLSGLALAGANRRSEAGTAQNDGILSAQEIASMDLSGVDLAVLSACETGLGEILPGEGVFGLRRALQIAGARTAIVSLWQVEDRATREWMSAFYEAHFRRGRGTAEAVRDASLRLLHDRRNRWGRPFYWAAFVPVGDWR